MREIKFEVWDAEFKKLFSWEELLEMKIELGSFFRNRQLVRRQYTGLEDKSGREIYEGDIVEIARDEFRHEVEWIEYEEHGYPIGWGLFPNTFEYEVIGNIYENPELLGDDK